MVGLLLVSCVFCLLLSPQFFLVSFLWFCDPHVRVPFSLSLSLSRFVSVFTVFFSAGISEGKVYLWCGTLKKSLQIRLVYWCFSLLVSFASLSLTLQPAPALWCSSVYIELGGLVTDGRLRIGHH